MILQPGSALRLLFERILKWVYFYVYALRENIYTASSKLLPCCVFHAAYIVMLLQAASLGRRTKPRCQVVFPSPFAMWTALDKSVFNVILQQCDGCEEWHLLFQFDLHPRSINTKCWCSFDHDDAPNPLISKSPSLPFNRLYLAQHK